MTNKIRSLIGALAIAGAVNAQDGGEFPFPVASADTNNVKFVEGPTLNYDTGKVKLVALFPAGHTNNYTLQSRTNLVSGTWEDSSSNTNLSNKFVDFGITNRSINVGIYEPITNVKQRFYRLMLN